MKSFCLALALVLLAGCTSGLRIDDSHTAVGQNSRVQYVVLHYTSADLARSLDLLTTTDVSSHYLIGDRPATLYRLVDENRRAWHAGASYWAGATNLNSASIGIEIVNPGFTETPAGRVYAGYPQSQVDEVIRLVRQIVQRHQIRPDRILGHNDIAPGRKQDPGPAFPWKQLADAGLIPWPDPSLLEVRRAVFQIVPLPDVPWFQQKLAQVGYQTPQTGVMDTATREVISTFQMKYRPTNASGEMDAETAALLDVVTTPGGMVTRLPVPSTPDGRADPRTDGRPDNRSPY
jgi:N-acetylmuramoyl-L-alanine amidase